MFKRRRQEPMPSRFHALAAYNDEVAHGIVHTPEWTRQMVALQADYDQWANVTWEAMVVL